MAQNNMNNNNKLTNADDLRLTNRDQLNNAIQPLLTDLYQITMAYAYWKNNHNDTAVFDLFFRKNPFGGEFTIFAGLHECLKYLRDFKITQSDIDYLKSALPSTIEDEFYEYLKSIDLKDVTLHAIPEGSVVFPRVPLIRVEGPIIKVQLLETTLLVLVNYASLVTTNAARFKLAAGENKKLFEFGLRRAQGPDGGLGGSKYCYIGGFDATSNVLAGKLYGIPIRGTNAHSFVSSFNSLKNLKFRELTGKNGKQYDLIDLSLKYLEKIKNIFEQNAATSNEGELASFIAYAVAFPNDFLVLIDTYDVLKSGILNFIAVALAIHEAGYTARGIRLDSGDLAYLSKEIRRMFIKIGEEFNIDWFAKLTIVASNDINDEVLHSLNAQHHEIDSFGIGTHLITCQKQPALGCVYKLVEINGKPCIKLSEEITKVTFPGKKDAYRLYDSNDKAIIDLLVKSDETYIPKVGEPFLCQHPFVQTKRSRVTASRVEPLYKLYWSNGQINESNAETLTQIRDRVASQMNQLRSDHVRPLYPTPYKISVSHLYYDFMHNLWLENCPIGEIK